jgi:hypothetical protein
MCFKRAAVLVFVLDKAIWVTAGATRPTTTAAGYPGSGCSVEAPPLLPIVWPARSRSAPGLAMGWCDQQTEALQYDRDGHLVRQDFGQLGQAALDDTRAGAAGVPGIQVGWQLRF